MTQRLLTAASFAVALSLAPLAGATLAGRLEPAEARFSGEPGDCFDEHKVADLLTPLPPTDVVFLMDLTGSMGEERSQLIARMNETVDGLRARLGDVAFGLAWHRDYPLDPPDFPCGRPPSGAYGEPTEVPYRLTQPVTTDRAVILAAVSSLPPAVGGGDFPESYSGALHQVVTDPAVAWRPGTRRVVILFADDIPHDCDPGACLGLPDVSTGIDPGPNGVIGTPDDLPILDVVGDMATRRVRLLVVESSGMVRDTDRVARDDEYWQCWSSITSGFTVPVNTDGSGTTGETLSDIVVQMLRDDLDICPIVELLPQPGFESWLTSAFPVYYDVSAPARLEFDLRICIPPGTTPGMHDFEVRLACLGGTNATQHVFIDVTGCGCAAGAPVVDAGPLASTCFPDTASAEAAALGATIVTNDCASATTPEVATIMTGGCLATITVTASNACGSDSATYDVVIDPAGPALSGVPTDASVACNAVPPPATVTALDDCSGAIDPSFDELRIDGLCPDTYDLRRTWSATDACGNASADVQVLHVIDDAAPSLLGVPADTTVECDAVPPPASPSAEDACDPAPVIAFAQARIDGPCPGRYDLLRDWTATDRCGNASTQRQVVHVVDTTPPVIDPTGVTTHCVWPPNHRMVAFTREDFAPVITDNCSEPVTWRLSGCASSQPDDGLGDGATSGDCAVAPDGETVLVRAERDGRDPAGRTYRVSCTATDACGNESAPVVIGAILVPHDQSAHPQCERASAGPSEGSRRR